MRRASPATVEFTATPGVGMGGQRQRLESAVASRQNRDLDLRRRPVARDRQFLVPVEGDPDRRLGRLGELDRDDRLDAKRGLGAEAAADVLGHDPNLCGIELEALRDLGSELGHRLGRGVYREFVAVEAGDRRMRLEAGVLLDAGPERPLEQQRVACRPGAGDRPARRLLLERECGGRPADIAGPRRRRGGAFAGVVPLPLALREQDRRFGFARGVRPDHARQNLVVDLDRRQRRQRRLAIDRRDRGDRLADEVDHAVVVGDGHGGGDAGNGARGLEIDRDDPRASVRRAQDHAVELALVANIDGIDRFAGHLLPRFDARRAFGVAVVLAAAGVGDGAIDVVVGPAAAEVARKRAGDLLAGRGRGAARGPPGVVEGGRLDDEARGAEPALQRVERHERALNGMQFDGADALDRGHAPAGGGFRRQEAARDRNAVEQDRAGAADAGAADELGPGQAQCVAQDIDQERLGIVRKRRGAAVDEGGGHGFLLEGRRCAHFGRRGERSSDHQAKGTVEIGERACVGPLEIEPMRGELDRAGEPGRRHALPQDDLARGAGALDRAGDQAQFPVEEALVKITRLALLLGEQLLDLGRAFDQFEEIAKARLELRGENVGEPLAGLLLASGPRPARPRMRFRKRPR